MTAKSMPVCCAVVLFVLLCGERAAACSCLSSGPPCQAYGNASAVFVGTVTNLESASTVLGEGAGAQEYPQRLFTFRVDEAFRGIGDVKEVKVVTGQGGGDCGYNFRVGESYLVYAFRDRREDRLRASICSRTRPLADAGEDLAYIRNLSALAPGALISGEVRRYRRDAKEGRSHLVGSYADALLIVEGEGMRKEVRTDGEGRFRLAELRPGKHKVKLVLPDGLIANDAERDVNVADRGCATLGFAVYSDGRISGRVIDADGQPVAKLVLDILPADGSKINDLLITMTDEEGRFRARMLPPGEYVLGVNTGDLTRAPDDARNAYPRTYHPNVATPEQAAVITVAEGGNVRNVELRLPPRRQPRTIKGVAVREDGRPVPGARVGYQETTYGEQWSNVGISTDAQGRFSFTAYEGATYLVSAHRLKENGQSEWAGSVVVPAAGDATVRLVFK